MRRNISLIPYLILCLLLDTAVLPKWNFFGIRPWMVLGLTLTATLCFSLQTGMVLGVIGGFCTDILCGPALGLRPGLYLVCTVILHLCTRKNTPKPYVLFALFVALTLAFEGIMALSGWVLGGHVTLYALAYGAIPRAVFTGCVCLLLKRLCRPLLKGQVDNA